MTALGWTAEEVDRHDLLDVAALTGHWRTAPPTHVALAGLLGTTKGSTTAAAPPRAARPATKDMNDDEVAAMEKMLRGFAGTFGSTAAPST